jgi:hypothetical protein
MPAALPHVGTDAAAVAPLADFPKTLLVTNGNFLLEKALATVGGSRVKPMSPRPVSGTQSRRPPRRLRRHHLRPLDAGRRAAVKGTLYVGIAPAGEFGKGQPAAATIDDNQPAAWDEKHVFAQRLGRAKLQPQKVYLTKSLKLEAPAGSEWATVWSGTKGPLLLARTLAEGGGGERDLRLSQRQAVLAFDLLESNWPLRPSFVPFVVESVYWLAGRPERATAGPRRRPPRVRRLRSRRDDRIQDSSHHEPHSSEALCALISTFPAARFLRRGSLGLAAVGVAGWVLDARADRPNPAATSARTAVTSSARRAPRAAAGQQAMRSRCRPASSRRRSSRRRRTTSSARSTAKARPSARR